jgi:dynein heavy chain 1
VETLKYHYLCRLRQDDYDVIPKISDDEDKKKEKQQQEQQQQISNPIRDVRNRCVEVIEYFFEGEHNFAAQAIDIAASMIHVMEFTKIRVIEATFALIRKGISNVLEYNESHPELPIDD